MLQVQIQSGVQLVNQQYILYDVTHFEVYASARVERGHRIRLSRVRIDGEQALLTAIYVSVRRDFE